MLKFVISRQTLSHDKMGWKQKILADLMESFIGALFIDRGIIAVDVFMKVAFYPRLKHFIMSQVWNDPKSCLQQCCLTLRPEEGTPDLPEYRTTTNNSSKMRYRVEVYFRGERIGEGHGPSIQLAEKFAARKALEKYYFPQREWQQYYINNKASLMNRTQKDNRDHAGQANRKRFWEHSPDKNLPPEREDSSQWPLDTGVPRGEFQPRIRDGIWRSSFYQKLQNSSTNGPNSSSAYGQSG